MQEQKHLFLFGLRFDFSRQPQQQQHCRSRKQDPVDILQSDHTHQTRTYDITVCVSQGLKRYSSCSSRFSCSQSLLNKVPFSFSHILVSSSFSRL